MEFNIRDIKEEKFANAISGAWGKLTSEERISVRQSYINYLTAQDGLLQVIDFLNGVKNSKPENVKSVKVEKVQEVKKPIEPKPSVEVVEPEVVNPEVTEDAEEIDLENQQKY